MKTVFAVFLTIVVLFAVAAVATLVLELFPAPSTSSNARVSPTAAAPTRPAQPSTPANNPPAVPPVPEAAQPAAPAPTGQSGLTGLSPGQDAEQLAQLLQERLAKLDRRETELAMREDGLRMIQADILRDRQELMKLQQSIDLEMRGVLGNTAQQLETVRSEKQQVADESRRLEERTLEYTAAESSALRQRAGIFENMEPEPAAEIIRKLVSGGNLDTAAKLLGFMRERQAASVLESLHAADADLAGKLVDRLSGLRRSPVKGNFSDEKFKPPSWKGFGFDE